MREGENKGQSATADLERPPTSVDEDIVPRLSRMLAEQFPGSATDISQVRNALVRARIKREDLYSACLMLRDQLGFEHITMISAVEYDDRFELVYHISSYRWKLTLELITTTPKDDPSVESVSAIWGGANWQEREAFDLMGIKFVNHPKLERILLPKDYLYHPLRKDFKGGA